MSDFKKQSEAQEIAQKYFDAIASKNVDAVIALCDENVTVKSPLGSRDGKKSFRDFADGFAKMIIKLTPLSILGWEGKATIIYIADTFPVQNAYVAEHLTVEDGKITSNVTIYDSMPFATYVAAQQKQ